MGRLGQKIFYYYYYNINKNIFSVIAGSDITVDVVVPSDCEKILTLPFVI